MTDNDIVVRLDRMISILQLAYSDEIAGARAKVRADPIKLHVLDATEAEFVKAGDLKSAAAKITGESERTVSRRIQELVTLGALERRGGGQMIAYKSTGLI
jgi:Fic family protein